MQPRLIIWLREPARLNRPGKQKLFVKLSGSQLRVVSRVRGEHGEFSQYSFKKSIIAEEKSSDYLD